jgi:hypothetical protein
MAPLGTQLVAGTRVQWRGRGAVPEGSVGCLDRARLSEAVARLRAGAAVDVRVDGDGVRAELPPGARGVAVLAAPRIAGWRCEGRPAGDHLGLVAAPLEPGRRSVRCAFRTPGLRSGAACGAAAAVVLAGVWTRARRARRPYATKTSPVHHRAVSRRPAGSA